MCEREGLREGEREKQEWQNVEKCWSRVLGAKGSLVYSFCTCLKKIIKKIKCWILFLKCFSMKYSKHTKVSAAAAAAAKSLQSCSTLCDPRDSSPPGSPVPGTLLARTLEWVAISFSNAEKWKVKVKSLSCVRLLATPWTAAYQAPPSMGFSRQEYWSGVPLPSPQKCLGPLKEKYWNILLHVHNTVQNTNDCHLCKPPSVHPWTSHSSPSEKTIVMNFML